MPLTILPGVCHANRISAMGGAFLPQLLPRQNRQVDSETFGYGSTLNQGTAGALVVLVFIGQSILGTEF